MSGSSKLYKAVTLSLLAIYLLSTALAYKSPVLCFGAQDHVELKEPGESCRVDDTPGTAITGESGEFPPADGCGNCTDVRVPNEHITSGDPARGRFIRQFNLDCPSYGPTAAGIDHTYHLNNYCPKPLAQDHVCIQLSLMLSSTVLIC